MAIDFTRSPARSARSVSGGVVGMAPLASSATVWDGLTVPAKHQVVARERVPVLAPITAGHRVNSVSDLIEGVLNVGSVDDVVGAVVKLVAVSVPSDEAIWSRPMEGQRDQDMEFETPFPPVVSVESDVRVSLISNPSLQNPAFGAWTWGRNDLAPQSGSVIAEPFYRNISVIHDHDHTQEGAVA